ncbi:phage major capsid protein [Hymenobacter sp. BT491]|uniref:phage major capsid protein n=1 Tax=Hymenobacter sp. BT491 TaxID=2766779 RepID=UPI001653B556|nr:phage major capsid protein [Hymenobacter sp. BT491]MBC6988940.1 phage major capsid protein [Hymenobacter sp. BT491]
MDDIQVKEAAERLKTEAKTAAVEAGKEAAKEAVSEVKTLATEAKTAVDGVKETLESVKSDLKKVSDQADETASQIKRSRMAGPTGEDGENTALKAFNDKAAEIKAVKPGTKKSVSIELDAKAAVIITTGSVTTLGGPASVTQLPGVVVDPKRRDHIRSYMNVGQMATGSATYLQHTASRTRGAGMVGEGGLKGQSDLGFITKRLDAKKIANTFKITEETVDDIPLLMSTIQQEGIADIDYIEDDEILFGDGTGNHLEGVYTQASAFTGAGVKAEFANEFDVLRAAVAQLAVEHFLPTLIILSPVDVANMDLEKGEDGHYLVPAALFGTTLPSISGVRIVENTAMPAGEFLVGDFAMGAQLFDRTGLSVRIYDQNEDDAKHNLLLIVIEKRIALKVGYPKAFVKGTFETAKPLLAA